MAHSSNHAFVPGGAAYATAVRALPGYAIVRAVLNVPVPYQAGFDLAVRHLAGLGRTADALCAAELRVPAPLSLDGFGALNGGYVAALHTLGVMRSVADAHVSPIARTNVAPIHHPPAEAALAAFCYTVPDAHAPANFVVAGCGDVRDDDSVVAADDVTADGLDAKARFIMDELYTGLNALDLSWNAVTDLTVYSVHEVAGLLQRIVLPALQQPLATGVHLYTARPPITGLDLEMDVRGVVSELRLM